MSLHPQAPAVPVPLHLPAQPVPLPTPANLLPAVHPQVAKVMTMAEEAVTQAEAEGVAGTEMITKTNHLLHPHPHFLSTFHLPLFLHPHINSLKK